MECAFTFENHYSSHERPSPIVSTEPGLNEEKDHHCEIFVVR